ncbi:MAG: hypothetical protein ACE5MG_00445, partial [Candidatus Methylomirabilales bacterium]
SSSTSSLVSRPFRTFVSVGTLWDSYHKRILAWVSCKDEKFSGNIPTPAVGEPGREAMPPTL